MIPYAYRLATVRFNRYLVPDLIFKGNMIVGIRQWPLPKWPW